MKIGVICGYLDSIKALASYTVEINKAQYCKRHGYELMTPRTIHKPYNDPRSHASGFTWARLDYLRQMLESGKHEWIWTVGADTLITNQTKKLEEIIATALTPEAESKPLPTMPVFHGTSVPHPLIRWPVPKNHPMSGKKHLLICGECVSSLQADSFIMRSSPESIAYLKEILRLYPTYKYAPWVEQQVMMDLRLKYASMTHIVPQWMMNSYDYKRWPYGYYLTGKDAYGNRGQWQPGDFLIHWPGCNLQQRLKYLEFYRPLIRA